MSTAGFAPTGRSTARILVLGTLPGARSVAVNQYYAQPGNVFWTLMGRLFGAAPGTPYKIRLEILADHGIALWDVCAAAARPGSLDASIQQATVVANDLAGFYAARPHLQRVCFNGLEAASLYRRLVRPSLGERGEELEHVVLPSTSGANAAITLNEKVKRWTLALRRPPRARPRHDDKQQY